MGLEIGPVTKTERGGLEIVKKNEEKLTLFCEHFAGPLKAPWSEQSLFPADFTASSTTSNVAGKRQKISIKSYEKPNSVFVNSGFSKSRL